MKTIRIIEALIILSLCNSLLYAQDTKGLFKEGTSQIKKGNYESAINKLQECLEADPRNIGCHCNLAVAYAYHRETDKAIQEIGKVIYQERAPERGILFYNLAGLYKQQGNKQEAKNNYELALYLMPNFVQPYMGLATLYIDVPEEKEKAVEYLTKAQGIDSFMPDIMPNDTEKVDNAYPTFFISSKISTSLYLYHSPAWHLSLAINHMNNQEFEIAMREIDNAESALDKDSPLKSDSLTFTEVPLYRGNVYLLKKDWDSALSEFKKAYAVNPKHIGALSNLGYAYYAKGDFKQSLKYCDLALGIEPSYAPAKQLKDLLSQRN